ncbi:FAD-dependent oxidoreductase [Paracidobacterium acidisoli]|nr:FAD-dependent monooxygenase [Paracidobacterium acidisoli]MBT9331127.1 FAD-dependent monooxygenase [Paracidobacterium acidisoli]
MNRDLHVLVIGGGIGGLCLAQGLKKSGVSVTVCERDTSAAARLQGFRIHIDPQGSQALHDCLPEHRWNLFTATCGDYGRGFTLLSEKLDELMQYREPHETADPVRRHRSVSRSTLRQVLLAGLGDTVRFNRRFVRYERGPEGRITAFFEDGSTEQADVMVAADGVNSRVREQYLPGNEPVDTGSISLGGKIPLTDGVMALLPPCLLDGPAIVLPPSPANLFMAAWRRSAHAKEMARQLRDASPASRAVTDDEGDYVVMALGARREYFRLNCEPEEMTPAQMLDLMRSKVSAWHPNLRKLVEMMNHDLGFLNIRTSRPVAPWTPTNITLLGDAIHSMTPYRGVGANIALRDAGQLCAALAAAARGERPLTEAIGEYEAQMRVYGFHAVSESLKSLEQAISEKKFGFRVAMSAMRMANHVPALRRKMVASLEARPPKSVAQAS